LALGVSVIHDKSAQLDEGGRRQVVLGIIGSPSADAKAGFRGARVNVIDGWQHRELVLVAVAASFGLVVVVFAYEMPMELLAGVRIEAAAQKAGGMDCFLVEGAGHSGPSSIAFAVTSDVGGRFAMKPPLVGFRVP